MTTVKEFENLGVVIVDGDKCTFACQEFEFNGRPYSDVFADSPVTHFAWRPLNTIPDNPKFKYERTGSIDSKPMWRPLLDQPKVIKSQDELMSKLKSLSGEFNDYEGGEIATQSPTFTRAIADVAVGFKLRFTHDIDGKFGHLHRDRYEWEYGDDLEVIHKTINHNEDLCYIVLNCQPDVLTTAAITDLSFFDTRTPKQKAVDEMLEHVRSTAGDFCEALYNAGYRKVD